MLETWAFQQAFAAMLNGQESAGDPALRRALAVHRNTAFKAAQDALAANYPVVEAIVGAEAFDACAHVFVELDPPSDPRLCLYGEAFPAFVAGWPHFTKLEYLPTMAKLERLVVEALFASDAEPLDAAALAADLDPDAPLELHPATRIGAFDCPVASLWQAHRPEAPQRFDTLEWVAETVLVTRPALRIDVRAIDAATHAFLTAPTLGEAAMAAAARGGDVAAIFTDLLTLGAFARPHS
jgi:hypothetical protein